MNDDQFIADIYEAGAAPELWGAILDKLAEIADAKGTVLFAANSGISLWRSSEAILPAVNEWLSTDWVNRNSRGQRLIPLKEPRFLTDFDGFTKEELETDPFYAEFLRSHGLGWCVGTAIHSPSADSIVFSIERTYDRGPVEQETVTQLDGIRPHLARAALFSARLGLERARATVEALARIGLPAAICNYAGRVIAENEKFAECAPSVAIGARDMVQFASPKAQALFAECLAGGRAAQSIPLARTAQNEPFIMHVMPLHGSARDVFSGASWVMFATFLSRNRAPAAELLQGLYDLTPSESRIAERVTAGHDVQGIATLLGVSAHTVRAHMKSIFNKTGVRRQAELVSLLAVSSFEGGHD